MFTGGAVAPDDEVENEEHEEDGAGEQGGRQQSAALPLLALEGLVQTGRSEPSKGTCVKIKTMKGQISTDERG